jgi:hypothetical protein
MNVGAVHVPPDVETDENDATSPLDRDDLAEQDGRVLGQAVSRFGRDEHVERCRVARDDVRVGLQLDRGFFGACSDPEAAAHVDLDDRMAGCTHALDRDHGGA